MLDTLIPIILLVFIIFFGTIVKRISGGGTTTTVEYHFEVKPLLPLYRPPHPPNLTPPDLTYDDLPRYRQRGPRRRND